MALNEAVISEQVGKARLKLRDEAEYVLSMAPHVAGEDRPLIEAIYRDGHSINDVSRLTRTSPRTLQRRLARIVNRMTTRQFRFVVLHGETLPRDLRAVARRTYLEGRSIRQTARLTGRGIHGVREQRTQLAVMLAAEMRGWHAPPMAG